MSNNAKNNHETLKKYQLNMFWGFLRNFLKIWFSAKKFGFSAQMSSDAKNSFKHPENTN